MHIHGLSRPVLGQQCLRARFHPECAERGASRISTPGQRSRRARNCVSGQRRSQDGGAAAPARKAGLKESDAAAEYLTADGDPIQATQVWRHSSDASTPHRQLAAIEPAADGPGVCCRRRAPTTVSLRRPLIKLALPTVLVLLMTPAAEHEARPAFCMVRRSPACEQNAVAGAFAFLTT
jgi:hypothetical protein